MTIDEMWDSARDFYENSHGVKLLHRPSDEKVVELFENMERFTKNLSNFYYQNKHLAARAARWEKREV